MRRCFQVENQPHLALVYLDTKVWPRLRLGLGQGGSSSSAAKKRRRGGGARGNTPRTRGRGQGQRCEVATWVTRRRRTGLHACHRCAVLARPGTTEEQHRKTQPATGPAADQLRAVLQNAVRLHGWVAACLPGKHYRRLARAPTMHPLPRRLTTSHTNTISQLLPTHQPAPTPMPAPSCKRLTRYLSPARAPHCPPVARRSGLQGHARRDGQPAGSHGRQTHVPLPAVAHVSNTRWGERGGRAGKGGREGCMPAGSVLYG